MSEERPEPLVPTPATINIGQHPDIRGSLKFTAAPAYGPAIVITLTLVQFAPAAAMQLIAAGNEIGYMELEGDVLVTGSPPSFGTVTHPDGTLIAPNITNYYLGAGMLSFQKQGGSTFTELGNAPQFEFEPQVQRLEHYQSMSGVRSKDFSPIAQQSARCRLRLEELTAYNMAMYFMDNTLVT